MIANRFARIVFFIKSIKLNKKVYLGDPINTVRLFNDMEVNEWSTFGVDAAAACSIFFFQGRTNAS